MQLQRLVLEQFRGFERAELELGPGLSLFTGGNGAGKTSILEAAYLLAYGRSFRGAVKDGLIRRGQAALRVYAEVGDGFGQVHRLGLERGAREGQARVDGRVVVGYGDLYRHVAVVCFEPGSHELIAGGSEQRRRFLDWTLFHVEPEFLAIWRRAQRALRQRNALLKQISADDAALEAWEVELANVGDRLTRMREAWLTRFQPHLVGVAAQLLPELGEVRLDFERGWSGQSEGLLDALRASRPRDKVLGHTTVGPHRANWSLGYAQLPGRETFSRGQEKLSALACVLAQGEVFAAERGFWPILCLDDLASELDREHLAKAWAWLDPVPAQKLLTGTEIDPAMAGRANARFHVEQGGVTRLL